jgi:pimeloyl-ACP methyl ester carboxylesterase
VLLIHGISSSGASWTPILAGLGGSFTPVTIDLRGHGQSGRPATGYLYDDYAGDIAATIDALGMVRPLIVGHSLGGLVALRWAAMHPDDAAAIVIEESPLRSGEDFRAPFDRWIAQNAMPVEELAGLYREKNPALTHDQALQRAGIMTGTAPAVFTELRDDSLANEGTDRIADFERIASPILFIRGEPDLGSMVHPGDLAGFSARLENVTVVPLPGVGHNIHGEMPEAFLGVVVPFLKAHAASPV